MSAGPSHTRSGSSTSLIQPKHGAPVLGVAFNQDNSCFAVGLDFGFRVFSTDPLREILRRGLLPPPPLLVYTDGPRKDTEEGGFSLVAMLYRSNILALVGGGRNPRYATNKVILFDEKVGKPQAELEFRSDVKNIVLRRDQYELG